MKILVLGGTRFVGRHIVELALARGHAISLFNRGISNPELFPQVESLRGDREGDLGALEEGRWDAVIDTSGYLPRIVRASAERLVDSVSHYTFISTISVFADFSEVGIDEDSSLDTLEDESVEEVTGETYGPLKARCEAVVREVYPGSALVIRPGLIVGPHDPTDRFTYWVHRVAQGGEVLAPGDPRSPVQFIDARDLAAWTLDLVATGESGTFNATGPEDPHTMAHFLGTCNEVSGSGGTFTWVPAEFLLENGVEPWSDMPLWMPQESYRGLMQIDVQRAVSHGLQFRPLEETARDTLAWAAARSRDHEWQAGISTEREENLLEAWHEQSDRRTG